ncbi:MAG: nicotinate (nicotinamide) nucleotide adenylyltransferase [Deltaproteobacteria bacterium]|nr:nicotinate (nicotinamide) nucleotide adenylyltransferase [Deltaproteobacteria bacterium]
MTPAQDNHIATKDATGNPGAGWYTKVIVRVGLYGGSFDPPHIGHLLAATYARAVFPIDEVWLIPCHTHAFAKELAPFEHRLAMCEIAAATLGPWCRANAIERDIAEVAGAPSPSRTIDTVRALASRDSEHSFALIIGSDLVNEIPSWHRSAELSRLCPIHVVPRQPFAAPDAPAIPDVSSTTVRAQLAEGASIAGLVPHNVAAYIRRHHLYGATAAP